MVNGTPFSRLPIISFSGVAHALFPRELAHQGRGLHSARVKDPEQRPRRGAVQVRQDAAAVPQAVHHRVHDVEHLREVAAVQGGPHLPHDRGHLGVLVVHRLGRHLVVHVDVEQALRHCGVDALAQLVGEDDEGRQVRPALLDEERLVLHDVPGVLEVLHGHLVEKDGHAGRLRLHLGQAPGGEAVLPHADCGAPEHEAVQHGDELGLAGAALARDEEVGGIVPVVSVQPLDKRLEPQARHEGRGEDVRYRLIVGRLEGVGVPLERVERPHEAPEQLGVAAHLLGGRVEVESAPVERGGMRVVHEHKPGKAPLPGVCAGLELPSLRPDALEGRDVQDRGGPPPQHAPGKKLLEALRLRLELVLVAQLLAPPVVEFQHEGVPAALDLAHDGQRLKLLQRAVPGGVPREGVDVRPGPLGHALQHDLAAGIADKGLEPGVPRVVGRPVIEADVALELRAVPGSPARVGRPDHGPDPPVPGGHEVQLGVRDDVFRDPHGKRAGLDPADEVRV